MTKLLLVSHEASRTGAPRMAVEILRATEGQFDERVVVIRWPGPLQGDLAAAAERSRLEPLRHARVLLRRFRRTRRAAVRIEEAAARRVLRKEMPDLVYLNTVLSACYVRPALELGLRVVLHSHELGQLASGPLTRYRLEGSYDRIHMVACSQAARTDLQRITGVEAIDVLPSVVDVDRIEQMSEEPLGDLRAQLGAASERGLVIACGTADVLKGADTWLQLAPAVKRRLGRDCPYFIWIGADEGGRYRRLTREMRLDDHVRFVGSVPNPHPLIASADIVAVPSRQDAFPLVVLEGMALARPIVAFDVGGIAEQLGETGVLVPPDDVEGMADAVVTLMADEAQRGQLGHAGRGRMQSLFTVRVLREQLACLLAAAMARGSSDAA